MSRRRGSAKTLTPLASTHSFRSRMPKTHWFGVPAATDSVQPTPGTDAGLPPRDREVTDVAWSVVSYLLTGILLWGGIGWLVDRWLDLTLFAPLGVLLGAGLSLYLVFARLDRSPPAGP